jgi:Ca-activated chloride channel family protein
MARDQVEEVVTEEPPAPEAEEPPAPEPEVTLAAAAVGQPSSPDRTTYRGPGDASPSTPRQQSGNEVAGSDDFYLGRGERKFQPVGDAKHDPSTGTTHQWRDTRVAPSNPKGEPKLAFEMNRTDGVTSAGPSGTPAPSAGVSVGAGGKFGGRFGGKTSAGAGGKPLVQSDAIEKLKAMGYSGGATGSVRREALDASPPEEFLEEQPSGEPTLQDSETLTEGDEQRMGLPDANYWLSECVRRPNERPSAMFFRFWGDNAFELAARDPLSTFSIDVDTASYALARRTLEAGRLPVKEQVRTEEFLNYFAPDLQAPTQGRLALSLEIAPSRFGGSNGGRDGEQHWLLRAGIRAQEIGQHERAPLALTFVIDTSGSMEQQNRLELVKHALRLLVGQLDAGDQIALVGFSNDARVVLPLTNATRRAEIEQAIHGLSANGGTNAEAGLKLGYELAAQTLRAGATNRVVFLSDGVANIGQTTHEALSAAVQAQRARGIYLNTIGVGMGDHNDALLEQLADQGDGVCNYMDDAQEARRALVDNFVGAFQPVASDVKVQVEFDPAQVASYRLLGYENRAVADADFRRDAVDAGEIGSGQQVVALYELVRRMPAEVERPLAVLRVRSKGPKGSADAQVASEQTLGISNRDVRASYGAASAGYRRSALVAQFAEMLRQSVHARGDSLGALLDEARALERELRGSPAGAEFAEFVSLVERAAALALVVAEPQAELERLLDALRHNAYALARIDGLDLPELQAERERLLQRQRELEQSLRELLDPQRIDVAPR